jgi:hypothetical protein
MLIHNSGLGVFSSRISSNSGLNIRIKNRKTKLNRGVNMNTENLLSRITINPKVMVGKPTIRGMRITVEQILRAPAAALQ